MLYNKTEIIWVFCCSLVNIELRVLRLKLRMSVITCRNIPEVHTGATRTHYSLGVNWINICTAHFGSPCSFMAHRHGPPDSFGTPAFHPDAAATLPSLHRTCALFSFSSRRPLDMLSSTPAAPTALRGAIAAWQTAQSLSRRLASCTRLKTFQKAWDDRAPSLLLYPAMTGRADIWDLQQDVWWWLSSTTTFIITDRCKWKFTRRR